MHIRCLGPCMCLRDCRCMCGCEKRFWFLPKCSVVHAVCGVHGAAGSSDARHRHGWPLRQAAGRPIYCHGAFCNQSNETQKLAFEHFACHSPQLACVIAHWLRFALLRGLAFQTPGVLIRTRWSCHSGCLCVQDQCATWGALRAKWADEEKEEVCFPICTCACCQHALSKLGVCLSALRATSSILASMKVSAAVPKAATC